MILDFFYPTVRHSCPVTKFGPSPYGFNNKVNLILSIRLQRATSICSLVAKEKSIKTWLTLMRALTGKIVPVNAI